MLRTRSQYGKSAGWLALLFVSSLAVASPPSLPQSPRPEHQRKAHTKLNGVLTFPRSDWEKFKFNQARIGDFVEYRSGDSSSHFRRTVEEIGDHTLVVLETRNDKKNSGGSHIHYSFELPDASPAPGNVFREAECTVAVVGNQLPGRCIEVDYQDKALERRWYCNDVPLGGLVKHVRGKSEVLQILVAYGHAN